MMGQETGTSGHHILEQVPNRFKLDVDAVDFA